MAAYVSLLPFSNRRGCTDVVKRWLAFMLDLNSDASKYENRMKLENWTASEDLNDVMAEVTRLRLEREVMELDSYGFTVLPKLLSADTVEAARTAITEICEAQTGIKPNFESGEGHPNYRLVPYLMGRRPVFQDIMMNEKAVALVRYLLGKSAQLSSMTCHFKGPGDGGQIALHTDTGMPAPLPPYSQVSNVNYALTDYTKEGGCLALVPGSHKWARNPEPEEVMLYGPTENHNATPMELSPGDAVIWHGNLWHGSYPRTIPGLRLNLAVYYARSYWKLQERYADELPDEVIARHGNNPTFRQLAGFNDHMGWKEEGPNFLDMKNGGLKQADNETLARPRRSWHS